MKKLLLSLCLTLFALAPAFAQEKAKEPIKIGDMYAYTAVPDLGALYKKGWEKAVAEINAKGGLLGRPVEIISRDHGDTPEKALLVAQDLVEREKVDVLAGTILAHITNAVANYTGNRKTPLVTIWNTMPVSAGKQNEYMFSVLSTEALALAAADIAAKSEVKKWATIAPNFAYGRLAVQLFRDSLKKQRPDVTFVDERWPTLGKLDAAAEVASLKKTNPDAIFSCVFTSDLVSLVRTGNQRGLFEGKTVLGMETGYKAFTKLIGKELKGTWYVSGDPSDKTDNPTNIAFMKDYRQKFGADPEFYTYAGYIVYRFIFAAIEKAGSTEPDKIVKAMEQISVSTPFGDIHMNPANHRSNFGGWFGRLQPTAAGAELVDWEYKDATKYVGFQ